MKRARFTAPARREYLVGIAYYKGKELKLGIRFARAVEEATARAVTFRDSGSPASRNTRRVFLKDFPFSSENRHILYRGASAGWVNAEGVVRKG